MSRLAFPDDLILELPLPENLVEHDLDVVASVPIAVVVEGAGGFEDAVEFEAAGTHEFDVGLGALVAVLEGTLFFGLAPEDLVVAVRVKGRVDVDKIDTGAGEVFEDVEVVATPDDAGVDKSGRAGMRTSGPLTLLR
jgi:hypothetical protein